jgi:hypothetical protein
VTQPDVLRLPRVWISVAEACVAGWGLITLAPIAVVIIAIAVVLATKSYDDAFTLNKITGSSGASERGIRMTEDELAAVLLSIECSQIIV